MMDRDAPAISGVLTAKPPSDSNSRKNPIQPFGTRRSSRRNSSRSESKENIASDMGATAKSRPKSSRANTNANANADAHIPQLSEFFPHTRTHSSYLDRTSSSLGSSINIDPHSPRDSRIPRPKSTAPTTAAKRTSPGQNNPLNHLQQQSPDMRQPLSLKSAFELAQREESDSQPDDTFNIRDAFKMASAEINGRIDGSPSPAPRHHHHHRAHLPRDSQSATLRRPSSGRGDSDLRKHLQQFDRNHQLGRGSGPLNGLFNKNRDEPKALETRNGLSKKTSNGSLGDTLEHRRTSPPDISSRNKDAAATGPAVNTTDVDHAGEGVPIPSIEFESPSDDRNLPIALSARPSPEKSYWHLDADFTAGDLQVSDSPRIRTGQSNGRSGTSPDVADSPGAGTPKFRRSNNRLDQIRQREIEAANAVLPEDNRPEPKRRNSRLDEVRAREMEALSKRAVATSRLDEIRVRNSEARSESPETGRHSSREELRGGSLRPEKENETEYLKPSEGEPESELKGEHVSDPPISISHNSGSQKLDEPSREERNSPKTKDEEPRMPPPRSDSHDLLRRLARATSASPPVEEIGRPGTLEESSKERPESRESSRPRSTREWRRSRNLEVKSSRERPTVGFVGVRRTLSSDSMREKRASLPGSEADPTDRIEAEMKLFAPLDNYSEKGSVRGPSPAPSEPMEEETPRPTKIDPLTQPTPRVTGAYIETPATVKVKEEARPYDKSIPDSLDKAPELAHDLHSKGASKSPSEDGIKPEGKDNVISSKSSLMPRSSSVPTTSRRSRSLSRRRRPLHPLVNTAKPPTVKDDIRAILRMNQIDDSTLDEFDSILANQEIDDEELEEMVKDNALKLEDDLDIPGLTERDRELLVYDRMSKSLKTGLLGIRSAKKGIERLEDKVTHTEHKADQALPDLGASSSKSMDHKPAGPTDSNAIMITIPRLYRKSPKFRLTIVGLLTIIVLIWYALESIFCSFYAVPQYDCTPEIPCDWSPNEPYYPYTMPFMLDEWTTGGKGRALVWKVGEEVGDILADVSDWITKTDFTQFDQQYMNVWQRKRHRRRLRKHGLVPKWVESPGYKSKYAEWNAARLAREAAEEMGYDAEDEMMSADERIT
ncbi:hypothetical protein F4779DRAFT_188858 [Xylariaceae sp. FL0662B]|nr:hypothetical protein F4779DRAFT_188858 [Xylariaceae sp. FL0662B]